MIDKFFNKMFEIVDNFMGYLFDKFISDAPKNKNIKNVDSPDNRMNYPKE